jgi:hypothetical protein
MEASQAFGLGAILGRVPSYGKLGVICNVYSKKGHQMCHISREKWSAELAELTGSRLITRSNSRAAGASPIKGELRCLQANHLASALKKITIYNS